MIASVREHAPNARMAVEEYDGDLSGDRAVPGRRPRPERPIRVVSDAELAPEPVTRLIIRDPEQSEADFVQLAERLGLHGVSYFVGWTAWLDIAPEGVDKSTGLKVALAQYELDPSGLVAIGDGRNDIEMLTFAGLGIAMGSAPDEVKAAADEVTKSVTTTASPPYSTAGSEQLRPGSTSLTTGQSSPEQPKGPEPLLRRDSGPCVGDRQSAGGPGVGSGDAAAAAAGLARLDRRRSRRRPGRRSPRAAAAASWWPGSGRAGPGASAA